MSTCVDLTFLVVYITIHTILKFGQGPGDRLRGQRHYCGLSKFKTNGLICGHYNQPQPHYAMKINLLFYTHQVNPIVESPESGNVIGMGSEDLVKLRLL